MKRETPTINLFLFTDMHQLVSNGEVHSNSFIKQNGRAKQVRCKFSRIFFFMQVIFKQLNGNVSTNQSNPALPSKLH